MLGTNKKARFALGAAVALPFAAVMLATGVSQAETANQDLTIKITHVKALDKFDEFSTGDMYARVTIDGDIQTTPVIKSSNDIKPDWKITKKISSGDHKVKIQVFDKDVTADDPIDINRVDNKRDLDFSVNSKKCRIEGFASTYSCGTTITRSGNETKKADFSFSVNVKK